MGRGRLGAEGDGILPAVLDFLRPFAFTAFHPHHLQISPEYTSQIGKIKYMRRLGLSIHESASYVIGLGKFDKLTLPVELEELLPASTPKELKKQWATVTRAFSGIRTHAFYLQITEKDWSKRKKKELKNYAAILKEKDNPMPILSKSKTSI